MKRTLLGLVLLFPLLVFGQRSNTVYVDQFPGTSVAAKTAAAQLGCSPDGIQTCIVIFDTVLSAYPIGSMPSRCSQCVWIDFRSSSGVQFTPSTGGLSLSTSGQGWWLPYFETGTNAGVALVGANNQVRGIQVVLPFSITIRKVSMKVTTAVASSTIDGGIYDTSGNKLVTTGGLDSSTTGTKTATLGSPVVLAPGVYILAYTQSNSTSGVQAFTISSGVIGDIFIGGGNFRVYTAGNSATAGVLPATLGTLTNLGAVAAVPQVFFEP